jgi:hypothetical protein
MLQLTRALATCFMPKTSACKGTACKQMTRPFVGLCSTCRLIGDPAPVAVCTKNPDNTLSAYWMVRDPDGCKDRELLWLPWCITALLLFGTSAWTKQLGSW